MIYIQLIWKKKKLFIYYDCFYLFRVKDFYGECVTYLELTFEEWMDDAYPLNIHARFYMLLLLLLLFFI